MYSIETQGKLARLRQLQKERPLATEELQEVIRVMREERVSVQATSTASKTKKAAAKAPAKSGDDLLDELEKGLEGL